MYAFTFEAPSSTAAAAQLIAQGGKLLGTLAVLLVLGWLAALWLARHLAHWGQARGWSTVASVAAASGGAVVAFTVLALVSTLAALLWVGA